MCMKQVGNISFHVVISSIYSFKGKIQEAMGFLFLSALCQVIGGRWTK